MLISILYPFSMVEKGLGDEVKVPFHPLKTAPRGLPVQYKMRHAVPTSIFFYICAPVTVGIPRTLSIHST